MYDKDKNSERSKIILKQNNPFYLRFTHIKKDSPTAVLFAKFFSVKYKQQSFKSPMVLSQEDDTRKF
jgi:hypothetical protein